MGKRPPLRRAQIDLTILLGHVQGRVRKEANVCDCFLELKEVTPACEPGLSWPIDATS